MALYMYSHTARGRFKEPYDPMEAIRPTLVGATIVVLASRSASMTCW